MVTRIDAEEVRSHSPTPAGPRADSDPSPPSSTMISLQSLLCSPEPKDPQDAEVAKHYLSDRSGFEDTARYVAYSILRNLSLSISSYMVSFIGPRSLTNHRYWAEIYAGAPPKEKKEGKSSRFRLLPSSSPLTSHPKIGEEATDADAKKGKSTTAAKRKAPVVDEVAAAGLNPAHVNQFEGLGFDRVKVVSRLPSSPPPPWVDGQVRQVWFQTDGALIIFYFLFIFLCSCFWGDPSDRRT